MPSQQIVICLKGRRLRSKPIKPPFYGVDMTSTIGSENDIDIKMDNDTDTAGQS